MRHVIAFALVLPLAAAVAACSETKKGTPSTPSSSAGTSTQQSQSPSTTEPSTPPPSQITYTGPAPAAGRGALSGRVVWNDQPVKKAAVRLCEDVSALSGCSGKTFDTTTGLDGRYLFTDVAPGEYTLMVKPTDMSEYVFARTLSMEGDTLRIEAGKGIEIGDFPLVRFDLVLTSPADDATTRQARPALVWKAYPGAAHYEVALMPENGTSVFTSEQTQQPTITPPESLLSCEYSWWVEAYNGNGVQIGESADHYRFNVEGQKASCYIDVLAPADHATVPAKGVTLKWKAHPFADHYTILAWKGNDSSNPILDFLEVHGTSYTIGKTLSPGEYVYFINAVNSNGDSVATNSARYFNVG
jgi:hypothetical protein